MDGAQALVRGLENEGVEYIWGLSGGAAIPIFDALITTRTKIKLILVRHEQGASHMADGYARATGRPGVVLVTSGPGATNTVTGIMTAQMDSIPMVVLTGQTVTPMLGKGRFPGSRCLWLDHADRQAQLLDQEPQRHSQNREGSLPHRPYGDVPARC